VAKYNHGVALQDKDWRDKQVEESHNALVASQSKNEVQDQQIQDLPIALRD